MSKTISRYLRPEYEDRRYADLSARLLRTVTVTEDGTAVWPAEDCARLGFLPERYRIALMEAVATRRVPRRVA